MSYRQRLLQSLFFIFPLFAAAVSLAEDAGPTARGMLMTLPPSIFDNTKEGLDEAAKEDLLANGYTEYWEITSETPDEMIMEPRFFDDSAVSLRLFRNQGEGGAIAAIGTTGAPFCSLELWKVDAAGRVVPVDTPPEPAIREFFKKSMRFSDNNHFTVLLCLDGDRLRARPLIWRNGEMTPLEADRDIFFIWNGSGFEKRMTPKR